MTRFRRAPGTAATALAYWAGFGLILAVLSACGFTPLHDEGFGGRTAMVASIEIAPIPDRLGQITRNRLVERFGDPQAGEYRLNVTLNQTTRQFGFRGDNPVTGAEGDAAKTQEQVILTASFELTDLTNQNIVLRDRINTSASYDIVLSDFANVTQREDTTQRLALQAVDRIERRLGIYFKRKKSGLAPVSPALDPTNVGKELPEKPRAQPIEEIDPEEGEPDEKGGGTPRP